MGARCADDSDHKQGRDDPAGAVLGPNACMQLSTSVLNPSSTDNVVEGGFTYHCGMFYTLHPLLFLYDFARHILIQYRTANNDVVLNDSGGTCFVPCTKCARCEGIPTSEKRSVNESDEWSAVPYSA